MFSLLCRENSKIFIWAVCSAAGVSIASSWFLRCWRLFYWRFRSSLSLIHTLQETARTSSTLLAHCTGQFRQLDLLRRSTTARTTSSPDGSTIFDHVLRHLALSEAKPCTVSTRASVCLLRFCDIASSCDAHVHNLRTHCCKYNVSAEHPDETAAAFNVESTSSTKRQLLAGRNSLLAGLASAILFVVYCSLCFSSSTLKFRHPPPNSLALVAPIAVFK